jgi:hypothetical protein
MCAAAGPKMRGISNCNPTNHPASGPAFGGDILDDIGNVLSSEFLRV